MAGKRRIEVIIAGDASSLKKALGGASREAGAFGKRIGGHTRSLVRFAATAGGVAGVGSALAGIVKVGAEFEKQMSTLASVTNASGKEMAAFKKQAIDAGIRTKFSAKQAAEAQTELAKGGLSVKNIMGGGLKSALALAAAGNMDLADAAAATANAMNLFSLSGDKSIKVADQLATAANATTADVSDFALALKQGGSVAKTVGLSFTDTMVALESLASAGIAGSDAGTSLKTALIHLVNPTDKTAGLMHHLGLKFTDNQGKMKSLSGISQMLRDKLSGMTKAQRTATLAQIAGTDGVRTLTSLYDAGPAKLDKFRRGLEKQGTAAKTAAKMQDNLAGRFENLKGTLETLSIQIYTKMQPALNAIVGTLGDFATALAKGENPAKKLGSMISGAFEKINWDSVGAKMKAGLQKALAGFGAGLQFAGKLPGAIAAGIGLAISKIDTGALAQKFAEVGVKSLAIIADPMFWIHHLKELFAIVTVVIPVGKIFKIPGFGFLFEKLSRPLFSVIGRVAKGLVGIGGRLFSSAFTSMLAEVEKVAPRFAGVVLTLVTGGVRELRRLPSKLLAPARKAGSAVVGALDGAAGRVGQAVGKMVSAAISAIGRITAPFRSAGSKAASGVAGAIRGGVGAAGNAARKLGQAALDALRGLIGGFASVGRQVVQAILNGMGDISGAILGKVKGAIGGLGGKVKSLVKKAIGASVATPAGLPSLSTLDAEASDRVSGLLFPAVRKGELYEASAQQAVTSRRRELVGGRNRAQDAVNAARSGLGKKPSKGEREHLRALEGNLTHARKALRDFDNASKTYLSMAHGKAVGLANIQKYKDAINGLRDKMHGLAADAAAAFRKSREEAISAAHDARVASLGSARDALFGGVAQSAQSAELEGLQGQDKAEQDAKTKAGLDKDLADAKAGYDLEAQARDQAAVDKQRASATKLLGEAQAEDNLKDIEKAKRLLKDADKQQTAVDTKKQSIKDAEDAIAAYERQKREDELGAWIENEQAKADHSQSTQVAGLDQEEADYKGSLDARLQALTGNLEAGKETYKQFVAEVQGILGPLNVAFAGDPDEEGTITPTAPGKGRAKPKAKPKKRKKRAIGGEVAVYHVGELGPEDVVFAGGGGRVTQASQSKGGGGPLIVMNNPRIGSQKAARVLANKLAYRMAFGT